MNKLLPIVLAGCLFSAAGTEAQEVAALRLVQTIPMPAVEGRIDHFGVDLKGQRLFMSALGNNTLEVFDLRAGKRIRSIAGLHEPQGVFFVPDLNRIFVANSEGGALKIFDGDSFQPVGEVDFSDDADNVRYDLATQQIFVGYGAGALGIVEARSGKRLGDVRLEAHPESFQLAAEGKKIFVNVPNAREVVVIDRAMRRVVAKWPLGGYHANYPMALDGAHRRVFVACRKPPEVWAFDMDSGRVVAKLPCAGDADDMYYDAARQRLYVSGGEGFISVVQQVDPDHYQPVAKVLTAPGARTSYFAPELHRLYLAVPSRGAQKAELRVYEVGR